MSTKTVNELRSSRTAGIAACRFDSRAKQSGVNYSAQERRKQGQPQKKS